MKPILDTRRSGASALRISRLGFGAWALGDGGWSFGWAAEDNSDTMGAIRHALDLAQDWIEAAEVQGLGDSDEVDADVRDPFSYDEVNWLLGARSSFLSHGMPLTNSQSEMNATLHCCAAVSSR